MKQFALVIIIALRIFIHPANANTYTAPFTSTITPPITTPPAKVLNIEGSISNKKIFLNWMVGENESADQFEVERSTDGKNFKLAALVFGTDKTETGKYIFYEKAIDTKVIYRVKLVNKDKKAEYSAIVEVSPAA